jgi:D-alanyl-D-alanine carboxypeptidase/D-alanyl-D-alanine-endopeptidase (penicillin-binding protein 4)
MNEVQISTVMAAATKPTVRGEKRLKNGWEVGINGLSVARSFDAAAHNPGMRLHMPDPSRFKRLLAPVLASCAILAGSVGAQTLPPEVQAALGRAKIPLDAVSLLVTSVDSKAPARLSHRVDAPMNPASVMKLLTTYAALDLLGPAYVWRTPVWLDGPVVDGTLQGNLVIQGQGDPKLVLERMWLLLRRVQSLGVQRIAGNIVLDRHAFEVPSGDPADFDGEPLRPYNARPDALLLNYKALMLTFTPDLLGVSARVQLDPPMDGLQRPAQVPISTAECNDYRANLKADFSNPKMITMAGGFPSTCGEKVWSVAYSDPANYNARAIAGLWQSMGGQLTGKVVDGAAPLTPPTFEVSSPTLAEVIRDINKFSNNVMAQQLFLTLGLPDMGAALPSRAPLIGTATSESARKTLRQWWQRRIHPQEVPIIDNGSGLSRQTRISAQQLAQLLQLAWASPVMPELLASLPVVGLDGTLKRSKAGMASAHLKTGSLRDVTALAGVVHASSGRRFVLVAMVNHANSGAARPALDALIDWVARDEPSK